MQTLLLATGNPHKLDEVRAILPPDRVRVFSLSDVGLADAPEPVEDQPTFEGNALLKARYYAQLTGTPCLADDSGLAVDALDGSPGVLSARYAGATGTRAERDLANNAKLLSELGEAPPDQRTARFVCVMAYVDPDNPETEHTARGTFEGSIILPGQAADAAHPERGRGSNGFGYDPLFLVQGTDTTSAELSPDEKNARSHRGDATRKLWDTLQCIVS